MKNVKYISASAGSGKTYSLTKALTEAIQQGKVEPENVGLRGRRAQRHPHAGRRGLCVLPQRRRGG